MTTEQTLWDTIIIGTGMAGLSAGMYCGRFNMKTLVIGELPGGIITTTHLVENYPGILSISGLDMGTVFLEHAKKFGAELIFARATEITRLPAGEGAAFGPFHVKAAGKEYLGKTLIYATGAEHKKLGVPGEKEFNARGVSYCALCDAAFFKKKTVCVIGGGDSSAIESLILAEHCEKVYHFVRKNVLRAEPVNYERVKKHPKIEVRFLTEVAEIKGTNKVESVVLKSGEELKMDGVFVSVGFIPLSDLAATVGVEIDGSKQIKINRNAETNIPGFYAAGDVVDTSFKQAITGASEAVIGSYHAYQFVQNNKVG